MVERGAGLVDIDRVFGGVYQFPAELAVEEEVLLFGQHSARLWGMEQFALVDALLFLFDSRAGRLLRVAGREVEVRDVAAHRSRHSIILK